MQVNQRIRAADAAMVIRSRKHFAEAMAKTGYYLPSLHSAMCTLQWMYGVRFKTYYCPLKRHRDLTKECWHPPTKDILLRKLKETLLP